MSVGVVVIGRNEGERLKRCLGSIGGYPCVYVDSGSIDKSVEFARSRGVLCVELDMATPFTAARARNAGFDALMLRFPELHSVLFVDGDCEVQPGWVETAVLALAGDAGLAGVCGRRRERYPNSSLYNRLCDIEWDTPVGYTESCGGDALYRVDALQRVEGFDPSFIAGEEPELCFRLRQNGYKIRRLDAEMTLHDADMFAFRQWWKRAERSGYAFYLNARKHGGGAENFKRREVASIFFWTGGALGLILLAVATASWWPLVVLLGVACLQIIRIAGRANRVRENFGRKATFQYAAFVMLAKVPQCFGILKAMLKNLRGHTHTLVEYK